MTIRQKAPDSRVWRGVLRGHEEGLQAADSVDRVVAIIRQALVSLPGIGKGAVYLATDQDLECVAAIQGPESADLAAPGLELTGMARRAVREGKAVHQAGVSAGLLWAAPLRAGGGVLGAVSAIGENDEVPSFLAHAGLALGREVARAREGGAQRAAEDRAVRLERATQVLDAIVREGRTETVMRRITTAFSHVPALGKTTLWALRPEDGRYVEIARSENGTPDGFPAPSADARRAAAVRAWWESLPRFGGFAWVPSNDEDRQSRPGRGDTLFIPLSGHGAPHLLGFLLAELKDSPERPEVVEELQRWGALARLTLEADAEQGASLARLEELREEKQQVAELHRLKAQFIAAVSHELRTPLTSISAYAETLRSADVSQDPATRDRFLRVIHDEARRLARIVDDILGLATMDSGRMHLACRRIDLGRIVHDAFDVIHPIAGRKGIRIAPPSPEPATVQADPDLVKQLVVNLLENAVKFTDEGGEVRVRIEQESNAVRLFVEDDGPGIPAGELDAIFERFYQVDGTDARRHNGSGLGLAICKSIAAWHDGRIWAESGEGEGARFVVSLPRVRAVGRARVDTVEQRDDQPEEHRVPELIIEMVAEVVGAEAVSLMLLDEAGDSLFIQAAMGIPDEAIREVRVALGQSISGRVAETGETMLIPDIDKDDRFPARTSTDQYRTRALLAVPVTLRGETIGVINVTNKISGEGFSDQDRRLVEMLARRVALVMQKLREYGNRRDAIARMEDALQGVIDARRHYFPSRQNHTRLVLDVCRELGVEAEETTRIHYASILRDVGMIRLPEGVYRKPVRLSSSDRERIHRHPEEGAKAIRPIELESGVFDVILAHHEELDGTGYPRGLTGAGIPRGARILAVVDAYDALRTGRPYKKAIDAAAAVEELRAHAGSQFDTEVVNALVRVLEKRNEVEKR